MVDHCEPEHGGGPVDELPPTRANQGWKSRSLLQRYRQETVDPESLEIMRRNFGSKFKSRNNGRWKDLYPCRLPDCVKPAKIVLESARVALHASLSVTCPDRVSES